MLCYIWDDLYEQYESATLKRTQKKRVNSLLTNSPELEYLNTKIAEALHKLREHEQQHGCH